MERRCGTCKYYDATVNKNGSRKNSPHFVHRCLYPEIQLPAMPECQSFEIRRARMCPTDGENCKMTMDEHNKGRTEAEAIAERAAKPVAKCRAGEMFDALERRMFQRNRRGFDDAIRAAVVAMEDANFTPEQIQDFNNLVADFCGDTWNVDPRGKE